MDTPNTSPEPTLHVLIAWANMPLQHRLRLVAFLLRCCGPLLNPLCQGVTSSAFFQKRVDQEM